MTYHKYMAYGIEGTCISVAAPNMKAYTERVIGTIRREALDHVLLVSKSQIRNTVSEYIDYYNQFWLHQGIAGIPASRKAMGRSSNYQSFQDCIIITIEIVPKIGPDVIKLQHGLRKTQM